MSLTRGAVEHESSISSFVKALLAPTKKLLLDSPRVNQAFEQKQKGPSCQEHFPLFLQSKTLFLIVRGWSRNKVGYLQLTVVCVRAPAPC